jgi:hypothetical protein
LLEDLRRAQSRGEWPGANTTFCRGLWRGGSVDTDRPRDDVVPGRGRTVVRGGGISEDVAFPATMTGTVGLAFGVVGSSAVSDGGVDGASFEASADAVINSQRDPKPKTKNRKFPKISPVAIGISSGPHIRVRFVANGRFFKRPFCALKQPFCQFPNSRIDKTAVLRPQTAVWRANETHPYIHSLDTGQSHSEDK